MLSPIQYLKIALMTQGMELGPAARAALTGADGSQPLTLADYATTSGISLCLGKDVWANVPIEEHNPNFIQHPPYRLEYDHGTFYIRAGDTEVEARPVPVPAYHDQLNQWGERYTSYAITHTDRVRISPIAGCAIACQFCDVPYEYRYTRKRVAGLVDSVGIALEDSRLPARHVLISGGTPRPEDYDYENEVYAEVCHAFPGVDVDVMMVPVQGLLDPKSLVETGIHGLSINIEMYNEERARKLMAGKARVGRDHYLDFIARAVEAFGPGRIRSLLLVGLESLEDTLRGVEVLAERGCEPVLSPFRPDPSTPLRNYSPPGIPMLVEVYERSAEVAARHGVHLGPRCVPCHHNTLSFPDDSGYYIRADT